MKYKTKCRNDEWLQQTNIHVTQSVNQKKISKYTPYFKALSTTKGITKEMMHVSDYDLSVFFFSLKFPYFYTMRLSAASWS